MTTTQFNVGDRVRRIGTSNHSPSNGKTFEVGEYGTVTSANDPWNAWPQVLPDGWADSCSCYHSYLELIKTEPPRTTTGFGERTVVYEQTAEVGEVWRFEYNGETRIVQIVAVYDDGDIGAHCLTRLDYRRFKRSKIEDAVYLYTLPVKGD